MLIQDTITFQQNYFLRKIACGQISVDPSQIWYAHGREASSDDKDSGSEGQIAMFFEALVKMLLSFDAPTSFPSTFMIDTVRLCRLRSDLRDIINLKACDQLFGALLRRNNHLEPATAETVKRVRSSCMAILEESDGETRWAGHAKSIALEVTRIAHHVCGEKDISVDLGFAETILEPVFEKGSGYWPQLRNEVEAEMMPVLDDLVNLYQNMSSLEILHHVEARRDAFAGRVSRDLGLILKIIAHMGTLHWKVWAPLLYRRPKVLESKSTPEEHGEVAAQNQPEQQP